MEAYEDEHERMGPVTPQEAVEFMLEQKGMTRAELTELMGGRSRVSEFFSGKRDLSKSQIEALHLHLGIPADVLLGLGEIADPPIRPSASPRLQPHGSHRPGLHS